MDTIRVPLWELFVTFMKIGCFTFGGGYAMIGLIHDICVDQKKWMTHDEMMNLTVIAESTPGPIAINCATYIGYTQGGLVGAVLATLGIVSPAFLVIYPISLYLDNFLEIALVANAFRGIKIAVGFLILQAGLKLLKPVGKKPVSMIIFVLVALLMLAANIFALRISSIVVMVTCAVVGVALYACGKAGGKA